MSASFFDSNVALYLIGSDRSKARRARGLIDGGGVISVQVLNECAHVMRRKYSMTWPAIGTFLAGLCLRLAERYGFSIYDSFIVAAALAAGCDTLCSEDMQQGMMVDGRLRIANPFAP